MTEEQQYEAWLSGERIFEGTRLDNGELVAGPLSMCPYVAVWIDDIEIDQKKRICEIYWDDDDDPCTEVNKILSQQQTQHA